MTLKKKIQMRKQSTTKINTTDVISISEPEYEHLLHSGTCAKLLAGNFTVQTAVLFPSMTQQAHVMTRGAMEAL